jgi:3-hydroxyacyl-CoA dehydrogenase
MMEEMVKSGRLGRKSGKGFYEVSGVHRGSETARRRDGAAARRRHAGWSFVVLVLQREHGDISRELIKSSMKGRSDRKAADWM